MQYMQTNDYCVRQGGIVMLSPQEVAEKFDGIGLGKANLCVSKAILLGILAGMYIALAAVGANTGGSMMENPGVAKSSVLSFFRPVWPWLSWRDRNCLQVTV